MSKEPKVITIIVNGRNKSVEKNAELTFDQLVKLAFDAPPSGPNICFTISYRKGQNDKQGTLAEGESVKAKAGMVFVVTATDKS